MTKFIKPMKPILIKNITKCEERLFLQPKLNGILAMWSPEDQTLYSSLGNPIRSCAHLQNALQQLQEPVCGEIYNHKMPFQKISGLARRHSSSPATECLEFHIFDAIVDAPQFERILPERGSLPKGLKLVDWIEAERNAVFIDEYYRLQLSLGYEGIILRNAKAHYRPGKHVGNIYKMKPVLEMGVTLVDFEPAKSCRNRETFGSLVLMLPNGDLFKCAGLSDAMRLKLWEDQPHGSRVTIKYDELSLEGIPQKPRFKDIKWDFAGKEQANGR